MDQMTETTEIVPDWNGRDVRIVRSNGGVKATVDLFDNVLRGDIHPWPPPEIVQKCYGSDTHRFFSTESAAAASERLTYYSALQSLHSEDAVTWSVFGPVIYASDTVQASYARDLCQTLGMSPPSEGSAQWWLWRRIPHPDKPVSGGPEIDVGLAIGDVVILGEAKWGSGLGKGQGILRDKDQVTLRREWCEQVAARELFQDARRFVVLGISRTGDMLADRKSECRDAAVAYHDITWDTLASLPSHPVGDELRRYLAWKGEHTRETIGEARNREGRALKAKARPEGARS